jgi:hypothetical protein
MENAAMNPARTILLCGMLLTACATTAEGPWTMELTSSGGIAGRGNGAIVADSDDRLVITLMDGRQCSYTSFERQLGEAVAAARPQRWSESYTTPCADCFEWTLTLTRGEKTYTTSWLEIAPGRPDDLVRLSDALREVKAAYDERCRNDARK